MRPAPRADQRSRTTLGPALQSQRLPCRGGGRGNAGLAGGAGQDRLLEHDGLTETVGAARDQGVERIVGRVGQRRRAGRPWCGGWRSAPSLDPDAPGQRPGGIAALAELVSAIRHSFSSRAMKSGELSSRMSLQEAISSAKPSRARSASIAASSVPSARATAGLARPMAKRWATRRLVRSQ